MTPSEKEKEQAILNDVMNMATHQYVIKNNGVRFD